MRTYCIAQGTYSMLCGDLNGKEIPKKGDICIPIADSLCCTPEAQHCKLTISQFKKKDDAKCP